MAKTTKKTEQTEQAKPVVTRAEKRDATKNLIKEVLKNGEVKSNDLIDGAAKLYAERFGGEESENPNDVKGRVGSVLDRMKKEGEVAFEGGVYAMKVENAPVAEPAEKTKTEEKPAKKTARKTTKKSEKKSDDKAKETTQTEEKPIKEPVKAKRATKKKTVEVSAPQPAETVEENRETKEEKPAPKKRGRKAKSTETEQAKEFEETETASKEAAVEPVATPTQPPEEKPEKKVEEKMEEKPVETSAETEKSSPKGTLMDMSFLFGDIKSVKKAELKAEPKAEPKTEVKAEIKPEQKPEQKSEEQAKTGKKPQAQPQAQPQTQPKTQAQSKQASAPQIKRESKKQEPRKPQQNARRGGKTLTADEKLQEQFLSRLHSLGGEYFEYYSVYLLERYSRRNGRRLESLKITGGDHDGGIDGEIELTDKLGFRETIYIQAKNWDPDKGDEKLWVVGETLLQQFIGACVCRQAKDGKQHCRGIFITTSRFTPEAKRMLDDTSDKFVGYDGADLYEAAKECEFGLVKKNGEWALDEQLLGGIKAFFNMM